MFDDDAKALIEKVEGAAEFITGLDYEGAEQFLTEECLELTVNYSGPLYQEPTATGATIALTLGGPNIYLEVQGVDSNYITNKIVGYWAGASYELQLDDNLEVDKIVEALLNYNY